MAEKKKKEEKKEKIKITIKRPKLKKDAPKDIAPSESVKKSENKAPPVDEIAVKQKRSLIMFITAVILGSVIFIPGDMIWLWAHNAVRGVCSILSLYWPVLLLFLAIATMLDKEIPKLAKRTSFASGLVVALNACIYIFGFDEEFNIKQAFTDGVTYRGGGALGFIFGAPFIKLFGIIPAKILIILAVLTLAVFTLDIPIKKVYTFLFGIISQKIAALFSNIKQSIINRTPVSDTEADDEYFDNDDDYDSFDTEDEDYDEDYEEEKLPDNPVMSEDLFDDDEDYFPEDDEEEEEYDTSSDNSSYSSDNDDEYSIDIALGDDDHKKDDEEDNDENADKANDQDEAQNNTAAISAEDDEDALFEDIFGEGFLDTVEQGYKPEAAQAAREITESKSHGAMPSGNESDESSRTVKKRAKKAYIYPPTDLLTPGKSANVSYERELKENAKKLIETLESFSVGAKIIDYCRGPSVTRYDIQPARGVKISRITGLADDIALSLAADGGVRMEAPIPGKPAIGVEIPNKTITSVTMRQLLESPEFSKHKKKTLECVIGMDVAGKIVMMDLASMPHLLIAGTTGSGKSVCVNSILMSILFRATPDEVKLILIDPKLVEFTKYKGISHLLVPVVSDVKKAAGALGWAVTEMEDRYKQLSLYNVKDIDSYNRMVERNLAEMTPEEIETPGDGEVINGEFVPPKATKKMPKIVIAIDELADLMMAAPGEVEDYICRLAQKARAAGMHLVIATQRPSVNVITGVIKANIPSRISLKVASYVDSKTILDTGGGEKLIGKGDMLYNPVGAPKPMRVQGGYSSDEDIEAVTDFIKKHAASEYDEDISEEIDRLSESVGVKGGGSSKEIDPDDLPDSDPMLEDAIKAVIDAGQASASLLQRRLRVGYARAGRLIDIMEQMGIVGPHEGSKSRKVLLTEQDWIERKISGAAEG